MIYQNKKGELASAMALSSEIALDNIMRAMSTEKFSKRLSAKLVGGEKKLISLIERGKIQAEKVGESQNAKWYCNAAQVLANCKPFKRGSKRVCR